MHRKFVIYDPCWGTYLGGAMGLGFWTKIGPAGQSACVVFGSPDEAAALVAQWETKPAAPRYVPVDVADPDHATIAECVAAGLPAWDPQACPEPDDAPA